MHTKSTLKSSRAHRRIVAQASSRAASAVALGLCISGSVLADQAPAPVAPQAHGKMKMDLAARSLNIHWPDRFSPMAADLFSHNQLLIEAPCERVWKHVVDAKNWPMWYPNSKEVGLLEGAKELGPDVRWRWKTFGLAIESHVHEYVPYSRLGWYGYAPGAAPAFYHTWLLQPQTSGCLVVMEEVGLGKDAAHLRETDQGLMHRGHYLWLAGLAWVSEGF